MHAMLLRRPASKLEATEIREPEPGAGQLLVKVCACGVCRTDLHVLDGELTDPKLPLVLGHEIVGQVISGGPGTSQFKPGDRIGIPWLGWTCGKCRYCLSGQENLCPYARFTGYQIDGGYAELTVADARYCFPIPTEYNDEQAAPLLCAGLIGYRCLRMAGDAKRLGIYGFGAAAHIITQVGKHQGREIYGFTRPGDTKAQEFATQLGAIWTGGSDDPPPEELDAAIIFAPVGALIPAALKAVRPGGIVVCGGIHMSEIPPFSYDLLWKERVVRSVANLTRQDAEEFLKLAPLVPVRSTTKPYPLNEANTALADLRSGALTGAAVLIP